MSDCAGATHGETVYRGTEGGGPMSEWKGPWKCAKCGREFPCVDPNGHSATYPKIVSERCTGTLKPNDRRAPVPRVAALVEAAKEIRDAYDAADVCDCGTAAPFGYHSRRCSVWAKRKLLACLDAALEGEGR